MTDQTMSRTTLALWRRGQHGWPASFPLVQLPNLPLAAALAGWLVAAVTDGHVHDVARGTFYTGLAAWAWMEAENGVNWFRRAVGVAGLVFVIVSIAEALRS
jgi:hypothetical protein